ncbi:Rad2 nuclease [Monascus purpureus]|uniref:Rad2 nuclease n=1 Tax=Monascus purpureus TaxID=5098 RepID=A0A507QQZ8_MONPU|nr:Rad2 nuclease [Monascus purpureus]BDD62437.1 hypothetical protein MAP00_007405 [Monascus purpureus]
MGIKGLHGLLKSIQKPCHLRKFSGETLGVDAYGWLHRGTVACAVDLVLDRPTTKHIDFVLNRVRMLIFFGVTPYLVFDGDNLPSKSGTESERQKKREESKALGLELYKKGRVAEAYQELQKAVDVTPYMARQLIEELKKMKVEYVVAPYEADAQLVFLERQGIINGIISEDSDMLVFGARRLLSKLDQHGDCIEINRADFAACKEVSLVGWTDADFRRMCILSGCDYLPNISKLGLKTAYRSIRKYKNVDKALRMLQLEGQYRVPADYLENFKQAELTFLYQRVFCPTAGKLVTLTPPETDVTLENLTFIGDDMDPDIATGVARGDLDPTTKQPISLKPPMTGKWVPSIGRRQTFGSSADLKSNKPISSFFTPKRVPLAELDPNSLTPSPSQQRLLERHANSSWEASPVSAQPNVIRSAPADRVSSPLLGGLERNSSAQATRASSTFSSVKRPRLCSETEEESLPTRPNCRSRFFTPTSQGSSPSGEKLARSKKQRKSTLGVFSDEAAEEIMSQLPDPSGRLENPQDGPRVGHEADAEPHIKDCKPPSPSDLTVRPEAQEVHKEEVRQKDVPRLADIDTDPKVFPQVLDCRVERQSSTLLSKFAFLPKGASSGQRSGLDQKKPQLENTTHARTVRPSPGILIRPRGSSPKRQRLTPLQRLGQSALSRSRSMCLPTTDTFGSSSSHDITGGMSLRSDIMNTVAHQGSEDLLIPNSDEDDPDHQSSDEKREPVRLDLKKFSFAA